MSASMADINGNFGPAVASKRQPRLLEMTLQGQNAAQWIIFTRKDENNINMSRTGVGLHTLTYPPSAGRVFIRFSYIFYSVANRRRFFCLTHNPTGGISTFRSFLNSDTTTPSDFNSNDFIEVQVWGDALPQG